MPTLGCQESTAPLPASADQQLAKSGCRPMSTANEVTTNRELPERARRRLEKAVGREAPAISYAFLYPDGAVSTFVGGRGDVASPAALDPSEPLPLYSMTKTVTAIATLELLARDGFGLDADVRDLLPDFP